MRTQYIQSMMQTERSSVGATSRCGAHPPGFEPVVLQKKKSPRLSHVQSTCMVRPTHKATDPVYGWVQGFGVFFGLCENVFFLIQCRGGGLSPHRSSFFRFVIGHGVDLW